MIIGTQDIYFSVIDTSKAINIGLHPECKSIPSIPRDSHGAHADATLTLKSNDVPQDRKRIENFGCKFLGEADRPWGHMLVFEDPDGNVLKLMNPKGQG
jgi:catechol 2,3-dioxygenase-like lactoylglutathione lyase family enzyme